MDYYPFTIISNLVNDLTSTTKRNEKIKIPRHLYCDDGEIFIITALKHLY